MENCKKVTLYALERQIDCSYGFLKSNQRRLKVMREVDEHSKRVFDQSVKKQILESCKHQRKLYNEYVDAYNWIASYEYD